LLVLGAFAVVSLLMLGGWALTSGTPDVPARPAPAASPASGAAGGRAEEQAQQTDDGAQLVSREQEDAGGAEAARARDLARRARQRIPLSTGAAGPAAARRSAGPEAQSLRRAPDQAAAERQRAEEAKRLADLRRAEQLRQAELARQAEAAKRAEQAKRAADGAPDEGGADGE
jgi:hypothetical protein